MNENNEQTETTEKKPRRTLSAVFFTFLAQRLEGSEKGSALVKHIRERLNFYEQIWSLAQVLMLVILIRLFILTAFYIPSPSMLDTLQINDRVFVFRPAYAFAEPKVGDIVVFRVPEDIPNFDPDKPIWIKRIVGVAGDSVSIRDNRLCIDGEKVTDPPFFKKNAYFPKSLQGNVFAEQVVPEGHVMVFGDNSANSYDSRYWGPIPVDRIIGKAFVRFWPMDRIGPIHGESHNPLAALP
jgi:signal peptidase I